MNVIQLLLSLLGRICLSIIFIAAGLHKIFDWDSAISYAHSTLSNWQVYMAHVPVAMKFLDIGLSYLPILLGLATFLEIGGGILIFLGLKVRLGSFLLILFLIPTTLLFHAFWYLDGPERNLQTTMFLKNIAILGGLFTVLAFGSGFQKKDKFSN